ncbi:30S ribosomal protein S4 [Pseudokineococcus lusitanus]|uniref:Small ribosomal subunit protein uS4 n=1 Tax=Pseudokineococcus lusitanus TaxID=763993 RepID=A0A3N1G9D4_9ACTN|nr:30S ribosomal protein S4 [Pseudokineococcus lusitanus]ROP26843.1 small subunit ribosomal protein S4 [Pseudokineococcus lusitanus]
MSSTPSSTRSRKQVRLSRRLGMALTPKAVAHFEKRPYPPGEHGRARRRTESDYALRLREKQLLRAQYGIREAQLRRAVDEAKRHPERTGDVLVQLLESRLDAVVLRAGLARTVAQARQVVSHQHVVVDGQRVDKPSYRVRPGQVVEIAPRSRALPPFQVAAAGAHRDVLPAVPPYLRVEIADLRVEVLRPSVRDEVPVTCDVSKVVEYYSR